MQHRRGVADTAGANMWEETPESLYGDGLRRRMFELYRRKWLFGNAGQRQSALKGCCLAICLSR